MDAASSGIQIVEWSRMKVGHNFLDKNIVKLQIVEEALQQKNEIQWKRSTNSRIVAEGDKFYVSANLSEKHRWLVKIVNVHSGDVGVGDLDEDQGSAALGVGDSDEDQGSNDEVGEDRRRRQQMMQLRRMRRRSQRRLSCHAHHW